MSSAERRGGREPQRPDWLDVGVVKGYSGRVERSANKHDGKHAIRNPTADRAAVLAARRRPMSERLEVALSWNTVAAELRAGVAAAERANRR